MAGRGPAPKETLSRPRDQAKRDEATQIIESDGLIHGPELPETMDGWHIRTVQWWETWRRSPQAQTFIDTDWSFLLDTALMHHAMWSKGQWTLAAEVRLRVMKFGATPEDRARLKMSLAPPKPAEPTPARRAPQKNRRDRVLKVVGDADGA